MASRRHFYLITIYNKIVLSYLSYLVSYRQKRVINGVKSKFINYNLALGRTVGHFFSTYIREKKYTRMKGDFCNTRFVVFFFCRRISFFCPTVLLLLFLVYKWRYYAKKSVGQKVGHWQDTRQKVGHFYSSLIPSYVSKKERMSEQEKRRKKKRPRRTFLCISFVVVKGSAWYSVTFHIYFADFFLNGCRRCFASLFNFVTWYEKTVSD